MDWLDLKGPIIADTVYHNNKLVAKDVAFTLPAITPLTSDYRAMGTVTLPTPGMIEAMEAAITKIGIDQGLQTLVKLESATLEFRWAQDVRKANGASKVEGCKAFLRVVPKGIPGLGIDPGNASENEISYAVTRYNLIVAGVEFWYIDQLNQIMRIDGVDYAKDITSVL